MFNFMDIAQESSPVVEIVDSIMGSRKTTKMLEWIDKHYTTDRFIYVSPLISEVGDGGRIHRDLKYAKFHSPDDTKGNKSDDLLSMLNEGLNICCTHSLYLLMDSRHLTAIKKHNYILIIDEEIGVISDYSRFSDSDLDSLMTLKCIDRQESDGMLLWTSEDPSFDKPNHKYYTLKRNIVSGVVYTAKRSNKMVVTQLPVKLFTVAKRTIIITYMFEGNILSCFLKLKGVRYKPFTEITPIEVDKADIKKLITMYDVKGKWKQLDNFKLSNTWYTAKTSYKNSTVKDIKLIENFISSFARNTDCTYEDLMYTFPKDKRFDNGNTKRISPKSLIDRVELDGRVEKVWIATQTRATNDYAHKTHLVHAFNRYPNTSIQSYLQDYGQGVDADIFALSELVQWVWRSAIRNGEPITLCIVSKRMRKLFDKWLEED
ncbi:hypothetical protein [Vibrio phage vB_VhaM_VH-8]|nr:hypothetical protein [Vibrio phage vB_VhaM_VH-8]